MAILSLFKIFVTEFADHLGTLHLFIFRDLRAASYKVSTRITILPHVVDQISDLKNRYNEKIKRRIQVSRKFHFFLAVSIIPRTIKVSLNYQQHSCFSQSHKVGNIGIIVNFVFPYIPSFLLYLQQMLSVNVK